MHARLEINKNTWSNRDGTKSISISELRYEAPLIWVLHTSDMKPPYHAYIIWDDATRAAYIVSFIGLFCKRDL